MAAPHVGAHPTALLAQALRRDPARPFVTYYDLGSGGRVELSVATFDNWTNKTVGLLRDELDVAAGDRLDMVLPAHWTGLVLAMAAWTVGAQVSTAPLPHATVSVRAWDEQPSGAGSLVVVNTLPLGGPAGARAPSGSIDYGREVLGYPDVCGPAEPTHDPALALLMESASAQPDTRRLVVAQRLDDATLR
ncbi:MAG: TIGR03089 family protein, partial [Jiangellales bacterium]